MSPDSDDDPLGRRGTPNPYFCSDIRLVSNLMLLLGSQLSAGLCAGRCKNPMRLTTSVVRRLPLLRQTYTSPDHEG